MTKMSLIKLLAEPAAISLAALLTTAAAAGAANASNPFLGHWALTLPGGGVGWLGVTQEKGYYDASLLWYVGSVVPVASVVIDNDTLYITRIHPATRKNAQGKTIRTQQFTETITAKVNGDNLQLTSLNPRPNGQGFRRTDFTGKRTPPLPPAPDLSKVKFGPPIRLFNGKNLDGWRPTDPRDPLAWTVEDGVLMNKPADPDRSYANLRTDAEFEDFNLTVEAKVNQEDNSGIYLRGNYEIQIINSYGKPLDPHNMGALYSRITPTVSAEKPPGEWQSLDITFVDRHVTVILNGKKIIDNQPVLGCTGGALWADPMRPGPFYLQGDHTGVAYRNFILRPVIK